MLELGLLRRTKRKRERRRRRPCLAFLKRASNVVGFRVYIALKSCIGLDAHRTLEAAGANRKSRMPIATHGSQMLAAL